MIKVIFLDFDGTVSDAHKIAYDSLVQTLDDYGYKFSKTRLMKLLGNKMQFILRDLGIKEDVSEVRKRFYKYFTGAAKAGKIKPCVSLTPLWELSKTHSLIVISNSKTSFVKASIKTLKIKGLFGGIYGADKFDKKSDILKKLFKKMKIKPSEAMYVGDRFSDVEFARKAGCVAVAIHNKCSWSTLSEIKKEGPDFIIKDFRGLRKIIRESN